jgi:hypothetical protein
LKERVTVDAGVIDRDYRGNLQILLVNRGEKRFAVEKGDHIAQLILVKNITPEVKEVTHLPMMKRGSGGFGSMDEGNDEVNASRKTVQNPWSNRFPTPQNTTNDDPNSPRTTQQSGRLSANEIAEREEETELKTYAKTALTTTNVDRKEATEAQERNVSVKNVPRIEGELNVSNSNKNWEDKMEFPPTRKLQNEEKTAKTCEARSTYDLQNSPASNENATLGVETWPEGALGLEEGTLKNVKQEEFVEGSYAPTNKSMKPRNAPEIDDVIMSRGGMASAGLLEADQLETLNINPLITSNEKEAGISLLWEFRELFATKLEEMGNTHLAEHEIRLKPGARPYYSPGTRRFAPAELEAIKKNIEEELEAGKIIEYEGPWCAPIVVAKKKDGTYRKCIAYNGLNERTERDSWPLPNIEELLE